MILGVLLFMVAGGVAGLAAYWISGIYNIPLLVFAFYGGGMIGGVAWMTIRYFVLRNEENARRAVRRVGRR